MARHSPLNYALIFSMNFCKRLGSLTLISILLVGGLQPLWAQTSVSARDIQTSCVVSDIPALTQLSISWTGDCVAGKAVGVGNVIAFSNGELRYILRGQFVDGRIVREDKLLACAGGRCDDQVAPGVLREHVLYLQRGQTNAPAVSPATTAPSQTLVGATSALLGEPTEIRATDATYKGRFVLDKQSRLISGEGRVEFFDGRLYEGRLEAGRKQGLGTYDWGTGQRYVGGWLDDQPDGEGDWVLTSGDRYVGGFAKGQREGKGRMSYANKTEYDGMWHDGHPSGQGTFKFLNGDVYKGEFLAGLPSGVGTLVHSNGDRYVGQWLKGLRHGNGVAEWKDGQRYEGEWRADLKSGRGVMRFADGGSYEGAWLADRATGLGVIKFVSGDSYDGAVVDGTPHGKGIYTWGSGDKFEGEFASGRPTTAGVMTFYIAPATEPAPPAPEPGTADSAPSAPAVQVSQATLCSRSYNAARNATALKRFLETFPEDECDRHTLARQKLALLEENERKLAKEKIDRQAQAQALVGLVVAYRQEYTHCVAETGGKCQNVTYAFEVKGKIREVNAARQTVQLQVVDANLVANDKDASSKLYVDGKAAALGAFRKRIMGSTQSKSRADVGMEF